MSSFPFLMNQNSIFNPFRSLISSENLNMDWKETPHAHIFEVDLPGLTREDVQLEVHEGRILQISAERKEETDQEKGEIWHCRERPHGSFLRRFHLPENAKVDEIKASMRDGVLVVNVPIKDEMKKKSKHKSLIHISGDEHEAPKGLGRFVCCKV